MADHSNFGSLQAAVPLDKERGLALLSGQLLLAVLELALPVKVLSLQQWQAQGRSLRAHQREEPGTYQRCCPLKVASLSTFAQLTAFCFSWATS